MAEELVIRVVLKRGASADQFASLATQAIATSPMVDMVTVDMGEAAAEETRPITGAGGLTLEETRRLYVRFGLRPEERVRLARQQFSILGMLMNRPTVRGAKRLVEQLREWDPYTWQGVSEGSATKVYSRLADQLDFMSRRMGCYDSGAYRLTRRKGVYGWLNLLPEARR